MKKQMIRKREKDYVTGETVTRNVGAEYECTSCGHTSS